MAHPESDKSGSAAASRGATAAEGARAGGQSARREAPPPPDKAVLTERQAARLAKLSGIGVKELRSGTIAELQDRLKFRIDPTLLLFRRVCGRVVKRDPVSGVEYPVPFATVHVEDTDCGFLGIFPKASKWTWLLPLFCRREEIATTHTDRCGRFCVWVPRFEIDWIVRWRHRWICIFRPLVRDLIDELRLDPRQPKFPPGPRPPDPDPPPYRINPAELLEGGALHRLEGLLGRDVARGLTTGPAAAGGALLARALGDPHGDEAGAAALLDRPAFAHPMPPPLPHKLSDALDRGDLKAVAEIAGVSPDLLKDLLKNAGRGAEAAVAAPAARSYPYLGPYFRCYDVWVREVTPVLDVPDITFRVTQDVDGDGDEETIYSEGFFDVRWDAGTIPDVTLYASPAAVASLSCDVPDLGPCGAPAILAAGLMPLVNPAGPTPPYHDTASGYARRPNRPHPLTGLFAEVPPPTTLATAPFAGTLQLYGCNEQPGAQFYKVLYSVGGSPPLPLLNTWKVWRVGGGGIFQQMDVVPDAAGWYSILPQADGWNPSRLLMNWPPAAPGLYQLSLQLGDAARNAVGGPTPAVGIRIDNTAPLAHFTKLEWRHLNPATSWQELELVCPVVRRQAGRDIEFRVSYEASAAHLRSVQLSGGGCGGTAPVLSSAPATAEHWHTGPGDNAFAAVATFELAGSAEEGAYSFHLAAHSRAFNPAGGDGGFGADWNYNPVLIWTPAFLPVAVVST